MLNMDEQTRFVHQVYLENKVVTQYANPSLGERCFVNLFERYVSLLPEDAKGRNPANLKKQSQKKIHCGISIFLLLIMYFHVN